MSERTRLVIAGLRVAGPATVLAFLLALYLFVEDRISGARFFGVILLGAVLGFLLGVLVVYGSQAGSGILVKFLTAGNLPPAASYSYHESLVARGRPEEARAAYEAHLRREPGDLNARLALARLWRDQLGRPDKAEALYLEARRLGVTADQEFAIGNALIDLYRAGGQRGRELAELSRFAQRFAGTEAGTRARTALQRLKEDQP